MYPTLQDCPVLVPHCSDPHRPAPVSPDEPVPLWRQPIREDVSPVSCISSCDNESHQHAKLLQVRARERETTGPI